MIKLFLLVLLANFTYSQDEGAESEYNSVFRFSPSLGVTYNSFSSADEDNENINWLLNLRSSYSLYAENWQILSNLYLQYGQFYQSNNLPQVVQDNLIITVMPSIDIVKSLNIQLFLETAAQTYISDQGDEYTPRFLDPVNLYQTLFLGQYFMSESDDGSSFFELTYGAGYAVQQIYTDKYVLNENRGFDFNDENPLSKIQDQITLESGYSGLFKLSYFTQIGNDLRFETNLKLVAFTKDPTLSEIDKALVSGISSASISYKYFAIEYYNTLLYDSNYSKRRQLDQAIILGVNFDLNY